MTKKYTFGVEEFDENGKVISTKVHTFSTEQDSWMGYKGAMYNFFNFIRGEGYLFADVNEHIGVYNTATGEFRSACGEYY